MKFLLWSLHGDALGLADKLQAGGHKVQVYIDHEEFRDQYTGILSKVKAYEDGLSPDTIVLFDMVENGELAEDLRDKYPVFGASKFQDKLELDRSFGLRTMRRVGINVGETHEFHTLEECRKALKELKGRWVLKPLGNEDTSFTYVSPSKDHMTMYLEYLLDQKQLPARTPCLLQEAFEGPEISTEMWFSKGRPIPPLSTHTFERKKMMNDDLGPSIGCASSIVFKAQDTRILNKLFTPRLLRILEENQYSGPLDINSIIVNGEPRGLEFTARLGYNAIYAFLELLEGDPATLFEAVANGRIPKAKLNDNFAYCVRVSIPPYPLHVADKEAKAKIYEESAGIPVGVIPDFEHCWLLDVQRDKNYDLVTAGSDGVVMEVSDKGKTIEEARDKVDKHLKKLTLANRQYRTDGWELPTKYYKRLFT